MKILHTADWHFGAPLTGHTPQATQYLRAQLQAVPEKIATLCREEKCDLMLIAGDVFDGTVGRDTVRHVKQVLGDLQIPVVITPGNHDFCSADSPYLQEDWPENVHIFTQAQVESIYLPELECKIYGAGYEAMDCPALMKQFQAEGDARWHIGVLHGEVTSANSVYCPITKQQIQQSALDYLALGHIHKQGSVSAGETVAIWPGCPMGRGFDELGDKGVIIAEFSDGIRPSFVPLDTPRFFDETIDVADDPFAALKAVVPAVESDDFYRITFTGYSAGIDLDALLQAFSYLKNLQLIDKTMPQADLWANVDDDTLEGLVLSILKESADSDNETLARRATLAAGICRRILDGQEVQLP